MKRNKKNIAVLLASYNGEQFIKEQIDSILEQKEVNCKVFVFDDCSNDNTLKVVNENFSNHDVVTFVKEKATGSAALNFFYAIQNIDKEFVKDYDYFALADQDDIWLPNKLNRAITMLEENNKSLYASNLTQWDYLKNKKSTIKKSFSQKKYDYLFEGGSAGCTYVFDKSLFFELNNLLPKLSFDNWSYLSHDWLIYFYARYKNHGVYIDSQSHILYRLHSQNVHGHLNAVSFHAAKTKLQMIKEGWYVKNINGLSQLLDNSSEEIKIYNQYKKGVVNRFLLILKYNTSLIRSFKKFILFFVFSLIPINKNV